MTSAAHVHSLYTYAKNMGILEFYLKIKSKLSKLKLTSHIKSQSATNCHTIISLRKSSRALGNNLCGWPWRETKQTSFLRSQTANAETERRERKSCKVAQTPASPM